MSSLPFHVPDSLRKFSLVILPIIFGSICKLSSLKTQCQTGTIVMHNSESRIKCWKLIIHDRSLSSPELRWYVRGVCDDRDIVNMGGSSFLLLTLCTNNLPLSQFMHPHFTVQMVLFFSHVQRMLRIELI